MQLENISWPRIDTEIHGWEGIFELKSLANQRVAEARCSKTAADPGFIRVHPCLSVAELRRQTFFM